MEILDSPLRVQDRGYGNLVTVARLRNNSPVKWTTVSFEVQYFDKEGKLVGTKE